MCLPNLFIAGVAKGGTTALSVLLSQHPDIFIPHKKEPRFFLFNNNSPDKKDPVNNNVIWRLNDYRKLYEGRHESILVDASGYFSNYESLKIIHEVKPSAKFILLLRDPVERAYSHFIFSQRKGFEPLDVDFEDVFKNKSVTLNNGFVRHRSYIETGLYDKHLENFLKYFGRECLFIETTERFKKQQKEVLNEITDFLDIEGHAFDLDIGHKAKSGLPQNQSLHYLMKKMVQFRHFIPKALRSDIVKKGFNRIENKNLEKPKMNNNTRIRLQNLYQPTVDNLNNLYGIDVSFWTNFADKS